MIKDPNCSLPKFPISQLENEILNEITFIYNNMEQYIEEHKKMHQTPDISVFEKRIATLIKQESRILDLYQFSEIESSEIRKRLEEIKTEKESIRNNINEIKHYDYEGFKESMEDLINDWGKLDMDEKREYMMSVIDKIVLHPDKKIDIQVKINVAI